MAVERKTQVGIDVSAWTVRRWLHAMDWVGKRTTLVAKDDDPQRVERLARIRFHAEPWQAPEVMVFADALAIHLWPKGGAAWMPKGTHEEVMPPGKHATHDLAGALHLATGTILHGRSERQTHALCRDLLTRLDHAYPAPRITRISVVVDHDCMPKAKAVGPWIDSPPRCARLWLPTSGPQANPLERVVGDVHDQCTRHHQRKRLRHGVSDGEGHRGQNGPWFDKLSHLYDAPDVTAAVERIAAADRAKVAA